MAGATAPDHDNRHDEGYAVDRFGGPVRDPTRNVLDLVEAAIKRQDDLREMASMHNREMSQFRTVFDDKIDQMRAEFAEKLAGKESERLDSIRAVDQATVQQRATVYEQQVQALAKAASETAETLRKQVESTALASDTKNDAKFAEVTRALAALQEAQFRTAGGKEQVTETRASLTAAQGIIGTVLAVVAAVGLYLGVKNSDAVTPTQLQNNAPYVADKPALDASIARLQAQVAALLAAKK